MNLIELTETNDTTAYELVKISTVGGLFDKRTCLFFNSYLECIEADSSEFEPLPVIGRFYLFNKS